MARNAHGAIMRSTQLSWPRLGFNCSPHSTQPHSPEFLAGEERSLRVHLLCEAFQLVSELLAVLDLLLRILADYGKRVVADKVEIAGSAVWGIF